MKIINNKYNSFIQVEFNNIMIIDAIEQAIELSKKTNTPVLFEVNQVNIKCTADKLVTDVFEDYEKTRNILSKNFDNSIERFIASEIFSTTHKEV